ncbi:MAG TPA: hypothetical protein VMU94_10270, partial [Streptosporangiaceae bacterium]|nr:hypothetical protein [Streptosporangiaceae bacterium]
MPGTRRSSGRVAAILQEDESYQWPGAVDRASLAGAELVASYPRRTDVPRQMWTELLRQAQRTVNVLAFAGLFLTEEHPDWTPLLVSRAEAGSGRVIGGNLTTSDEASEVA